MSNAIAAAEPWRDVLANGASLVETYFLSDDQAYAVYAEQSEIGDDLMHLVHELVDKRRKSDSVRPIADQVRLLKSHAKGTDGLHACRESLAEIGISMS